MVVRQTAVDYSMRIEIPIVSFKTTIFVNNINEGKNSPVGEKEKNNISDIVYK